MGIVNALNAGLDQLAETLAYPRESIALLALLLVVSVTVLLVLWAWWRADAQAREMTQELRAAGSQREQDERTIEELKRSLSRAEREIRELQEGRASLREALEQAAGEAAETQELRAAGSLREQDERTIEELKRSLSRAEREIRELQGGQASLREALERAAGEAAETQKVPGGAGAEIDDEAAVDATTAEFGRVLVADDEMALLRQILWENGRPGKDKAPGERYPKGVVDKINERAQEVLGDDLLYEEGRRIVITEKFQEALVVFLNAGAAGDAAAAERE